MLASSLMSPKTSVRQHHWAVIDFIQQFISPMQNCIKEPILVRSIHSEGTALGEGSLCTLVLGSRIGQVHARFVLQAGKWIILLVIVIEIVHQVPGIRTMRRPRKALAVTANLLLCTTWGPCLHTPTLKRLGKVAGCWYYVSALSCCHMRYRAV